MLRMLKTRFRQAGRIAALLLCVGMTAGLTLPVSVHAEDKPGTVRVGWYEFVVFMVHSPQIQNEQITAKIEKINRALEETTDGLPRASISVGITRGTDVDNVKELFENTDAAMYQAKQSGKRTYRFHIKA